MSDLLQIAGALLVLVPFAALQLGHFRSDSIPYLWLNLFGATLLAVLAALNEQWGFLLLEAVWAIFAARSLVVRGSSSGVT